MSMPSIQFDPKIATDLPVGWQRPSNGQTADMFADLLADRMKQNVEADRREPAPKRHQHTSDAAPGRPSRVVVTHPRTERGEAKAIEDTSARLKDQRQCATEEDSSSEETAAAVDDSTDATPQRDADETQAQADESTAPTDQQAQAADPAVAAAAATVAVVPTQATVQAEVKVEGEQSLTITPALPTSAEGEALVPEQGASAPTTQDGPEPSDNAAAEQQAVEAMVEAGLSDGALALVSDDAAPAASAGAPAMATQPSIAPATKPAAAGPLLQVPEAQDPIAEIKAAPTQPEADRHGADIKIRPNALRAQASAADPKPGTPTAAAAPAQPSQPTPLQQTGAGAFEGTGDPLDQAFAPDGATPGWTLHLAQGAATKRPDFIAQLRQHLQNLPAHEQVAIHVQRALRDGSGKFSVQLSPAELGRIHVKLQIDEDKRVTAAVSVERPSTLELLQRDHKELERALHNAGLTLEGGDLSFSLGHGTDQDFAQDLNHSAAQAAGGLVPDAEAKDEQANRAADQVMDTAAGVVDLQV
jgi:hypothetical protein